MAFGRGKVILFGEHAVVHGRPALAAGIERGVRATASVAEDGVDQLHIEPWGAHLLLTPEIAPEGDAALLRRAFEVALEDVGSHLANPRPPMRVDAVVELPSSAGLGCSAALGVAVYAALDDAVGVARSAEERAADTLAWERVFHGNPSGVDNAMAALGGVAIYRKGQPLERLSGFPSLRLVVGHSGEPGSTKQTVASVGRQHARNPGKLDRVFDGMASIVERAASELREGNLDSLGQLMELNQKLLSAILVSTARLEELCEIAKEAGAYGAKLTGGGGGGCMIALVDEARERDVVAALEGAGAAPFLATVESSVPEGGPA